MLNDLIYRLRALFRRQSVEDELQEELQYHLDREADKYRTAGASPDDALRRARLAIGGPELVRQQCRDARGIKLLDDLMQDLRYGLRTLGKSPGFTMVTILTLAVGIGACTAIFSIVNAVLLRSLPYKDPGQLVHLYTPDLNFKLPVEEFSPSYADFFDLQRQSHSFSSMTLFQHATYSLASQDGAIRVGGALVDANFLSTLGSQPEIGRGIDTQDALPGHENVVVISHALWKQMFAADAEILTKSLRLDGRAYQIIGVMPEEFEYPHDTDLYENLHMNATQLWVPLVLSPHQKADRDGGDGYVLARLKQGVKPTQAQAEMGGIMAQLDLLHDPRMRGFGAFVKPFRESALGTVQPLMGLLVGAVSFVLLIACGNAANLLLARAASRGHELGVRATLGAGRNRVIRQILTESLLLGLAGGLAGVILAYVLLRALLRLDPGNIPRLSRGYCRFPRPGLYRHRRPLNERPIWDLARTLRLPSQSRRILEVRRKPRGRGNAQRSAQRLDRGGSRAGRRIVGGCRAAIEKPRKDRVRQSRLLAVDSEYEHPTRCALSHSAKGQRLLPGFARQAGSHSRRQSGWFCRRPSP